VTDHEKEIVLHVMKEIAAKERQCIDSINESLDTMCKQLHIEIPERRNGDRRNNNG